jgi:hypothetical protein
MPPSAPKAPAEPDWELLRQKKPSFSVQHIESIAELSEIYLQPEAAEFSEDDLISSLRALYELSRRQDAKLSKAHAKKVEKIVLGAFSKFEKDTSGKNSGKKTESKDGNGVQRFSRRIFHKPESEGTIISEEKKTGVTKSSPDSRKQKEKDIENAHKLVNKALYDCQDIAEEIQLLTQAENIYLKYEMFRKIGNIYSAAADSASDLSQRTTFLLKAADNYEKSDAFSMAGEKYWEAASLTSDPSQKQTFLSKAEENYHRRGNFFEAGNMYSSASHWASDPVQKQAFLSKAVENYFKGGHFFEVGDLYSLEAEHTSDPSQKSIFLSKAADNYEKSGSFEKACDKYWWASYYASDPSQIEALLSKVEEYYWKIGNFIEAGNRYLQAALAHPFQEQVFNSKSKASFNFANLLETNPDEELFLISLASRFKESTTKDLFAKLPARYLPIFLEESLKKRDAISELADTQLPEAFNRIIKRILSEAVEFDRQLSSGKKIGAEHAKYMLGTISELKPAGFVESVNALVEDLRLEKQPITSSFFNKLYKTANEKLKPIFKLQAKNVKKGFLVKEIELSLTQSDVDTLQVGLTKAKGGSVDVGKIRETYGTIADVFSIGDAGTRKEKVIELMRNGGVKEKTVECFANGKIGEKDAMQLLVAQADFGDLSPFVWQAIKEGLEQRYSGSTRLFEKFVKNGTADMVADEINTLILHLREFVGIGGNAGIMGDWLQGAGLGELMPKLRKCDAYQSIIKTMEKIRMQEAGISKHTREMSLVFGQENRLLDVYFGCHAGECFGDDPAFTLGRNDICTATLFQNGELAGGVLFLLREIEGKNSLVILAIDPSVKVTAGLTNEKQSEIVDWMMGEVSKYAHENGFGLYITDTAGGISQRLDNTITDKYFGIKQVTYENSGRFHRTHGYDINSAVNFILPSK